MTYITEGTPITRIDPSRIDSFPEVIDLYQEYPARVAVIPKVGSLYHWTTDLKGLLNRNKFDYRLSNHSGSFYFTDFPAVNTNCQVEVRSNLVMYWYGDIPEEEINNIESVGNGNLWVGLMNIGFDGRIYQNPDAFVRTGDGRYATEVVVFSRSLNKLGKISAYPLGSERILYRFLRSIRNSH